MNDWQMKEYNELRLEKIDSEYEKYIYNRALWIVKEYAFKNSMSSPYLGSGNFYSIEIETIVFNGKVVEVGFSYQSYYQSYDNYSEEYFFPIEWFICKEKDVLNDIIRNHIEQYRNEKEEERNQKEKSKESEIKALEEKLSKLKGENK